MKTFFIAAFILFAVIGNSQTNKAIDVQHYAFHITLSDESDTITGKAEIQVLFTEAAEQLIFDLSAVKNGKGMIVSSVTENEKQLTATQQPEKLIIKLASTVKPGDRSTFIINYKGIPSDGLIISKNKYGHRTFFADNWPNRGHKWIPCNDLPGDKATVEFIVTAPQHYQVVSNGVQVEETNINATQKLTHWQEDVAISTKVMVIGAADFAVNLSGTVDCIPVYSWVYPEDRDKGFYDYAMATEILPFFINRVGPYGYKKLANVESKTTFGGLENANTIFYSEVSITGTREKEDLLVHEIAHQWFGNMATEKTFAHVWLSEGFATYFETLYFENKYGTDRSKTMLQNDRQGVIDFSATNNHPVVDTSITDYMKLLTANVYQKGGWVLHMLRREVGDSLFWKSIRAYYAEYAGKNADTDDLQKIFEKVSGKDLKVFFKQWLYTGGQPILNITWKTSTAKQLLVTVNQMQETVFTFPLEIELQNTSGKTKLEKLAITKKEETFSLITTEKITNLLADPNINLLFKGKVMQVN